MANPLERAQPTDAEHGVEFIHPDVEKEIPLVEAVGFDVDDLLIERDENALALKLGSLKQWLTSPANEKTRIIELYRLLASHPDNQEFISQYLRTLSFALEKEGRHTIDDFSGYTTLFIHGHFDDHIRDEVIGHMFACDSEQFWEAYYEFTRESDEFSLPPEALFHPAAGASEVLSFLYQRGMPLFIVTNSAQPRALHRLSTLDSHFPLSNFRFILSAHELSKEFGQTMKKPGPGALIHAAHILHAGINPEARYALAYLGNGKHDATAAYAAGFTAPIVINSGRGDFSSFSIPHARFSDLSSFLMYLEQSYQEDVSKSDDSSPSGLPAS